MLTRHVGAAYLNRMDTLLLIAVILCTIAVPGLVWKLYDEAMCRREARLRRERARARRSRIVQYDAGTAALSPASTTVERMATVTGDRTPDHPVRQFRDLRIRIDQHAATIADQRTELAELRARLRIAEAELRHRPAGDEITYQIERAGCALSASAIRFRARIASPVELNRRLSRLMLADLVERVDTGTEVLFRFTPDQDAAQPRAA